MERNILIKQRHVENVHKIFIHFLKIKIIFKYNKNVFYVLIMLYVNQI